MNFLQGSMADDGFRAPDGYLLPVAYAHGQARTYGIRPEHLRLAPAGIEIEAVVIEPTGSETQVVAKLGQQSIIAVLREWLRIRPGERLRVMPDLTAVHMFDAAGQRIDAN